MHTSYLLFRGFGITHFGIHHQMMYIFHSYNIRYHRNHKCIYINQNFHLRTMGGIIILPTLAKKMCALLANVN